MVLRKDICEMNSDSPPKADAGLKPGGFTPQGWKNWSIRTYLVTIIYVSVCMLTRSVESACWAGSGEADWRKRSVIFSPCNETVKASCHHGVYFSLKSKPGFLYSAHIVNSIVLTLIITAFLSSTSWYSQVVDSQLWHFVHWTSTKWASVKVVECYLNPPVAVWLSTPAAGTPCKSPGTYSSHTFQATFFSWLLFKCFHQFFIHSLFFFELPLCADSAMH